MFVHQLELYEASQIFSLEIMIIEMLSNKTMYTVLDYVKALGCALYLRSLVHDCVYNF